MTRKIYLDELMEQLEVILDYHTDASNRHKSNAIAITQGSAILEGLVSEDPFVVNKAINACMLYIHRFNRSLEVH